MARRLYKHLVWFHFDSCFIHSALDVCMYVFITVHVQRVGVCWCVCAIALAIFVVLMCAECWLVDMGALCCVRVVSAFVLLSFSLLDIVANYFMSVATIYI